MREHMSFPRRPAPPLTRVKQRLPGDRIQNPHREVYQKLLAAGLSERISPGDRIAITAGSRGMAAFVELLSGIVDAVKKAGGQPFLIPAMGSHGGATPQGQTQILALLGVTPESIGAPIEAGMDTIALGASKSGAVAHIDAIAARADGIIVLGRTQVHPESAVGLASGLLKMITVGLGKQKGAQEAHNHGLWESIRHVPSITIARSKILFGVTMVENCCHEPMIIEALPASHEAFLASDQRLLQVSRAHLAKVPFKKLDLLIVDQLGKDISGSGMDLNVIGTWRNSGGPRDPDFERIAVLSLTPASLGNGLGIGLADFTTRRFMDAYDPGVTYVNLLTATEPGGTSREGPLPLALDSDRETIEVALYSSLASDKPRVCRIQSTALLEEIFVSEALLQEVKQNPKLSVEGQPELLPYDSAGNLF